MATDEQRKAQAREGLESYLLQRGIDPRKPFRCLNPDHEDKHPSMVFDPARLRVHCFACGKDYDIFDLVGLEYSLTRFPDKLDKACALLSLPTPKRTPRKKQPAPPAAETPDQYCARMAQNLPQTNYPALRGLSPQTCARFRLGFDPAFAQGTGPTPWQALIIPTSPDTYTARNTDPNADKRTRIRKHGGSPVYNTAALYEASRPVFIVEGELDALSIAEAGGDAVALGSTANSQRFLRLVADRPPTQPLLLSLDNDDEGRRATQTLHEGLLALAIPHAAVDIAPGCKDPNEALLADPAGLAARIAAHMDIEREAIEAARDAYLRQSAHHHIAAFWDGIHDGIDTPFIPTGFPKLDALLDGGLFEGLYILGAISSLGKTSLALQMADQIARSGQDVLIFSLEMARAELMAKSISRLTLVRALGEGRDRALAKTARGITTRVRWAGYTDEEQSLIARAVGDYGVYAKQLFISEGIGDIGVDQVRGTVAQHMEVTGARPVVVIDYLQILAPHSERATDKQNMDKAVLELKRISRDYRLPVVGISSFNRAGYREAVTMEAFKESGAIEYSSDVLIGLQLKGAGGRDFDVTEAKRRSPREVELVLLKNRNGPTGHTVAYAYYPMYNYFKEL